MDDKFLFDASATAAPSSGRNSNRVPVTSPARNESMDWLAQQMHADKIWQKRSKWMKEKQKFQLRSAVTSRPLEIRTGWLPSSGGFLNDAVETRRAGGLRFDPHRRQIFFSRDLFPV